MCTIQSCIIDRYLQLVIIDRSCTLLYMYIYVIYVYIDIHTYIIILRLQSFLGGFRLSWGWVLHVHLFCRSFFYCVSYFHHIPRFWRWEDLFRYISLIKCQIAKEDHFSVAKTHVHTTATFQFHDLMCHGLGTRLQWTSDKIWTAIGDRTPKEDLVWSGTEWLGGDHQRCADDRVGTS